MQRTATISIFLSDAKHGPVCRAQTCAHSGVERSRSAKAFLQGGPKMSDAKPVFSISPIVLQPAIVPVSSQRREVQTNM